MILAGLWRYDNWRHVATGCNALVFVGSDSLSLTSLQVFFGLPLGLTPSSSKSIYFFTQSFSSFLNTCPYHLILYRSITVVISSVPSFSFNSLHKNLSVTITPHVQLIILISVCWSVNSFSFFTGHVSLPCNMQLCIICLSQDKREDYQNYFVLYSCAQWYAHFLKVKAVYKADCFRFRLPSDLGLVLCVFVPFCSCVVCFFMLISSVPSQEIF